MKIQFVGYPVLPGPSDLVFLKLADGRGWAQSLSFQKGRLLSFTKKTLVFWSVGNLWGLQQKSRCGNTLCAAMSLKMWLSPGHPRGNPRGIPRDRCQPRRPARKDRLAPYRLPEGVRLPGKIRQDQAMGSRVCVVVFFGWPEEESFGDGWNHDWFLKKSDRTCVFCNIILWIHVMPWLMHTNGILTGLTLGCVWW